MCEDTSTKRAYETIGDQCVAVVCAMLAFKPSHRAKELARYGWGGRIQVERSRGYTSRGRKRAPAYETHSTIYTSPVVRDRLLERGIVSVSKTGAMRLTCRKKAAEYVAQTIVREDMFARHGDRINTSPLIGTDMRARIREIKAGEKPTLWRVEVIADSSGKWCSNAVTYPTRERAAIAGDSLAQRWTAVREWRVVKVES